MVKIVMVVHSYGLYSYGLAGSLDWTMVKIVMAVHSYGLYTYGLTGSLD